jgi:predicted ABC-type ATPase
MSVWTIDPDLFKERIPEYRALVDAGHPGAAGIVHEESKAISLFAYTLAIDQRINILYDSTLSGSAPNIPLFELARARGFRLELVAATVRPDTALRRVLARGQATGRYVAPRIVLWTHKQFSVSCAECAPYFDAWRLYDNNGPIDRVRRIVSGVRGLPDIIDNPAALAEFSSYSRINENAKSYEEIGL